jgi:hypothetical protein
VETLFMMERPGLNWRTPWSLRSSWRPACCSSALRRDGQRSPCAGFAIQGGCVSSR